MELFIVSYFAGLLTVAAPCILPLLPVILGGSVLEYDSKKKWYRPLVITGSLVLSVFIFTLLLKASTALLNIPQYTWSIISGAIVILLGVGTLFPHTWELLSQKIGLQKKSSQLMAKSSGQKSMLAKDVIMGSSLGPVFSSCSPTYALIVAVILPESLPQGLLYLSSYVLGLGSALLLIAYFGQTLISKLNWLSNPSGTFRKVIGLLFIIVGIMVITGFDKDIQAFVIEKGWYGPIERFEQNLR